MAKFRLEIIDKINEWIGRIVSTFIFGIMGITILEVMLRYGFNRPTVWVHETSQQLFAISVLLGGAYTLLQGGHVRVDVIYRRLTERGKAILELVTSLFFFLFVGLLLWKGGEMAWESVMLLERTQTPWEPYVFHVVLAIPAAAFLMLLQGLAMFVRNLRKLTEGPIE